MLGNIRGLMPKDIDARVSVVDVTALHLEAVRRLSQGATQQGVIEADNTPTLKLSDPAGAGAGEGDPLVVESSTTRTPT